MAVTFVAAGTAGAGTGAVTPGMPSGATTGDLLILVIEGEGEDVNDDSPPTGGAWNTIGSIASATDGAVDRTRCSVYWAWYDAGINLSVPDAGNHTLAQVFAFRGVDGTTPIDATPTSGSTGTNTTSHTAATGYTTATDGAMAILGFSHGDDLLSIASVTNAALASVGVVTSETTQGSDGTVGLAYGIKTTAGAVGSFTWSTAATEENAWWAFALRPSAAPPPVTLTVQDAFHGLISDNAVLDGTYSASNLYTPANALNADNQANSLGNCTNQSNTTGTISVTTDVPTQSEALWGSAYSIRSSNAGSTFQRIEVQLSLDGVTLDTSKTYITKVWYKRVSGSTTSGNGLVFTVRAAGGTATRSDTGDQTITEANTGTWTQWTSAPWSPITETQPDLWFVGSMGVSDTADDFYITNLEILEVASGTTLTVQDAFHGLTSDTPTLTSKYSLTVSDTAHGLTSDSPVLTSKYTLAPADAFHGLTSDSPTVTHKYSLSPSDAFHGLTSDNVTLTFGGVTLTVQDASHGLTSDNPTLTHKYTLAPSETTHGLSSDNATLSSAYTLTVAETAHALTSDSPTLSHKYALVPSDTAHGLTSDNAVLTHKYSLTVSDTAHTLASDNVVLELPGVVNLVVQDAFHGLTSDTPTLTHKYALVVSDAAHGQTADGVVLSHKYSLAPSDAFHGFTSDNVVLGVSSGVTLSVQDAVHALTSDNVVIAKRNRGNGRTLTTVGWKSRKDVYGISAAKTATATQVAQKDDAGVILTRKKLTIQL